MLLKYFSKLNELKHKKGTIGHLLHSDSVRLCNFRWVNNSNNVIIPIDIFWGLIYSSTQLLHPCRRFCKVHMGNMVRTTIVETLVNTNISLIISCKIILLDKSCSGGCL